MKLCLIYRLRPWSTHIRTQDQIMCVWADPKRPPFPQDVRLGIHSVPHWHIETARELNSAHSLRNVLRNAFKNHQEATA